MINSVGIMMTSILSLLKDAGLAKLHPSTSSICSDDPAKR